MRAWLTPESAPTATMSRRIFIPNSEQWLAIVQGAILPLIYAYNWQNVDGITPEEAAARALTMYLQFTEGSGMIGTITPYVTAVPPQGFLECDGSTHLREDYPDLYALLDTAFIVDADTFRTPDLRGRTVIGAGSGTGLTPRSVDAQGGEETHTLTVGEMPSHQHNEYLLQDLKRLGLNELANIVFGNPIPNPLFQTDFAGGDEPHNNMQPFTALKYGVCAL